MIARGRSAACWLAALYLALVAGGCVGVQQPAGGKGLSGWGSIVARKRTAELPEGPQFCVVVRTYWGHSQADGSGLRRLVRSLQRQTVQSWEAVLVVMDNRPFDDLHHILADVQDDRVWVFAEWIGKEYAPKRGSEWAPGYHAQLYNLTDDAISVCPPSSRWLMVTNGDNEYSANFMQQVLDAGDVDLVAFDFYSRFQRITAPACERFGVTEDGPACKRNRLRWCHTDLAANVLNYRRFVAENRRFGGLQEFAHGLAAEHFDGIMAQRLIAGNWKVANLHDKCSLTHSPSFQSCGWSGGAWDDRDVVSWGTAGGRCISQAEADKLLADDPEAEAVVIQASSDAHVTGFEGVQPANLRVRCVRKKDYMGEGSLGAQLNWFGMLCTDDYDVPAFQAWFQQRQGGVPAAPSFGMDPSKAEGGPAPADDYWALQQEYHGHGAQGGNGAPQQPADPAAEGAAPAAGAEGAAPAA